MKCPYCDAEMQAGFIQCRDGVYWSSKHRLIAALPIGGGETIKLNARNSNELINDFATAWCCEKCRKILIEY